MTTQKGKFIVFEGLDGAGKTTQIERVADWLGKHYTVKVLKELTSLITDYRSNLLRTIGNRIEFVEESVKPAIENGEWILCDRFFWSTIAYQVFGAITFNKADYIKLITRHCGLLPDYTVYLEVDRDIAQARVQSRDNSKSWQHSRFELDLILAGYNYCLESADNCVSINGNMPIEFVTQRAILAITERFNLRHNSLHSMLENVDKANIPAQINVARNFLEQADK